MSRDTEKPKPFSALTDTGLSLEIERIGEELLANNIAFVNAMDEGDDVALYRLKGSFSHLWEQLAQARSIAHARAEMRKFQKTP
jgi:hypothetical protein